jgi:hypothetical protein
MLCRNRQCFPSAIKATSKTMALDLVGCSVKFRALLSQMDMVAAVDCAVLV